MDTKRIGGVELSNMIESVSDQAKTFFTSARGSHGWDHTVRVAKLCDRIGRCEGADRTVLKIAALLHDIGRRRQDETKGRLCHAIEGAALAEPIIRELPVSGQQKENMLHCIRTHRFRASCPPETIEARVLFDADKLDAIGAVGVARAYLFAGEIGASLHTDHADVESTSPYSRDDTGYREFKVKLRKIKDRMLTGTGRRLALERHAFMEAFFYQFIEEYSGAR